VISRITTVGTSSLRCRNKVVGPGKCFFKWNDVMPINVAVTNLEKISEQEKLRKMILMVASRFNV